MQKYGKLVVAIIFGFLGGRIQAAVQPDGLEIVGKAALKKRIAPAPSRPSTAVPGVRRGMLPPGGIEDVYPCAGLNTTMRRSESAERLLKARLVVAAALEAQREAGLEIKDPGSDSASVIKK